MPHPTLRRGSLARRGAPHDASRARALRWTLVALNAFLCVTALLGGIGLVARPDGSLVGLPVSIMNGVFDSFLVPGLLLTGLGVLAVVAAWRCAARARDAWLVSALSGAGFAVWILVEVVILAFLHWAHVLYFALGLVVAGLALAAREERGPNAFGAPRKA